MYVFLDIDGVMVPAKSWKSPEMLKDGFPCFSRRATDALKTLIAEDGVSVILTSSHKSNYSVEAWKDIFKNRGIDLQHLQCLPANTDNLTRKEEIVRWFHSNSLQDDFIIIDDDKSLNDLPPYLKDHLVQTSAQIGLTEEHLSTVSSKLARQRALTSATH